MLLCAEIEHSQGAAETALLGYLTLALVAARTFPLHSIHVALPIAMGLPMSQLFTSDSLDDLARVHGFQWSADDRAQCSRTAYDVRVGSQTAISSTPALHFSPASGPPAPNLTRLAPNTSPHAIPRFYDDVWNYLRAILSSVPATRHTPLKISFLVHQMRPGPLAFGALYFPDEARRVLRTLNFAPGLSHLATKWQERRSRSGVEERNLAGPSEAARGCSYSYFSGWVANTRFTVGAANGWEADASFWKAARAVVRLSSNAGLSCAVVNVLPSPREAITAVVPIFANVTREILGDQSDFQVVHARKTIHADRHGSPNPKDAMTNVQERFLASVTPLFITDGVTHWADWLLPARVLAGETSIVLWGDAAPVIYEPLPHHRDCYFYRAKCYQHSTVENKTLTKLLGTQRVLAMAMSGELS